MHRVDFFDYTLSEPQSQQPANTKGSYVGILFFVAIIVLAAIVFLRQPVSDVTRAQVIRAQEQREERRRWAEYQGLKRAVEPRITIVLDKLNELEDAIQQIAIQFEEVTQVPLDCAHATATRRIDHLILKSDAFTTAWNQMNEARIPEEALEQRRQTVAKIRNHLQNMSLDPIHRTQLDELLAWIGQQNALLEMQRDCFEKIQNELL